MWESWWAFKDRGTLCSTGGGWDRRPLWVFDLTAPNAGLTLTRWRSNNAADFWDFYSRAEVDCDRLEKHNKRISSAVSPQGSGPDCCSGIQTHILYTQQNSHSRWFGAGRIKLCCRCKALPDSKRWLESVHVIITSCYLCTWMRFISLNNKHFGVCNYTISKLFSMSLKTVLNMKAFL